jgi:hypothetical protein
MVRIAVAGVTATTGTHPDPGLAAAAKGFSRAACVPTPMCVPTRLTVKPFHLPVEDVISTKSSLSASKRPGSRFPTMAAISPPSCTFRYSARERDVPSIEERDHRIELRGSLEGLEDPCSRAHANTTTAVTLPRSTLFRDRHALPTDSRAIPRTAALSTELRGPAGRVAAGLSCFRLGRMWPRRRCAATFSRTTLKGRFDARPKPPVGRQASGPEYARAGEEPALATRRGARPISDSCPAAW